MYTKLNDRLVINEDEKLKYLSKNLHLITLPNTLWATHVDTKFEYIGFLHLNLTSLSKINIDKALILSYNTVDQSIKCTIYINTEYTILPHINYTIESMKDITQIIYKLQELQLCLNILDINSFPGCKKYVTFSNVKNLCDNCSEKYIKQCDFKTNDSGNLYVNFIGIGDGLNLNPIAGNLPYDNPINIEGENLPQKKQCYNCEYCDKEFSSKTLVKEHTRLHTGETPYLCKLCNKTNTHRSTHHKHMQTHIETKPNLCNICGKRFCRGYRMDDHMLTHSLERPHACQVCFKRFTTSNNLKVHQLSHTGNRPYLCNICKKSYTTPSNLSTHIKSTHTEKKAHPCGVCTMSFVHPRMLRIHMRKHTGEKPFMCHTCGKAFAKNIHLTVHTRIHSGERPYSCNGCNKTFTTTGNLSNHKKVHHKDLLKPY